MNMRTYPDQLAANPVRSNGNFGNESAGRVRREDVFHRGIKIIAKRRGVVVNSRPLLETLFVTLGLESLC